MAQQLTNADVCRRLMEMWLRIPARFRPWRSQIWIEDRGNRIWLTIATPPFVYTPNTIPAAPSGHGLVTCRDCFENLGEHWIAVQMLYALERFADTPMPADLKEYLMEQLVPAAEAGEGVGEGSP